MERRVDIQRFDEHLKYLASAEYEMLGMSGEYFSYNNDAFLLLGAVIERITGRLYRRVMTDKVLDALGMNRSTYSVEETHKFTDVSVCL